jgi:hypothetical protein
MRSSFRLSVSSTTSSRPLNSLIDMVLRYRRDSIEEAK